MSRISQNVSLKVKQELALRPKILQSLKMLALPVLELESYIKQELQQNPLLELREEKEGDERMETDEPITESDASQDDADGDNEMDDTVDEAKKLTEILDQWSEFHYHSGSGSVSERDNERIEPIIRYERSGKEKYFEQLYPLKLRDEEMDFITELVDSCDSYGFLPEDYDITAAGKRFGLSARRSEELHQITLSAWPKGITARNISECLVAQLDEKQRENEIILGMVSEHFDDLIHRRYQKIASFYGVAPEVIFSYKDQVSKLDPKPGLRILGSNAAYVYPDVTLKLIDGRYEVIINDSVTPNIIISPRYRQMINRGYFDRETTSYVRERINSAKFLIKSIYMRMKTLEQVSRSIIKHQQDFFYKGSGIIHSLTYSTIAQDVGKSESTISRVVKHKYVETPYGVYAFRDFFTSTAGRDDNFESISRHKVKNHIIRLIDAEDKTKPHSDQEIVELLKEEGLNVSRRIVNKYRDEMGILNSRLRKIQR